jgi:hypothetical protein
LVIPSGPYWQILHIYAPPKTGIKQLLSKIPTPLGLIKKGLDALANKLPVNEAAIFQNELLGQGIKLDSLGRIVTDNYRHTTRNHGWIQYCIRWFIKYVNGWCSMVNLQQYGLDKICTIREDRKIVAK